VALSFRILEPEELSPHAIPQHQLAAVIDPYRPTSDLVDDCDASSQGNFGDFESLFGQLGQQPVIELGKPLPKKKYLPRKRAGKCHAAHNRELLGKKHS
jgi:hypothetical protein